MKILKKYKLLIFLLFAMLSLALLTSCGALKTKENHIEKTDSKEIIKDTVVITKTLPVTDTLRVEVPIYKTIQPECDSLVNSKVREELARLSTKKQSGKNDYGFYFDKYKNQLVAYANLQEQNSELRKQLQQKQKVIYKYIYREIPKPYMPKFIKYLAGIGGLSLFFLLAFIIWKIRRVLLPKRN